MLSEATSLAAATIGSALAGHSGTRIVGICGAQGSGKSTLAANLATHFEGEGRTVAILSLDDLYLARDKRAALARDVHALFQTRGVPGTHDVALGERVLDALAGAGRTALPRFDKSTDEPEPESDWPLVAGPADLVLFEGWCVGARPQDDRMLEDPINALERHEDPEGAWRRYANGALAEGYQRLFARLDMLLLLAAPGFEVVADWRREQEHALRARVAADGRTDARTMNDREIDRFVQHYERLTRHILGEMPARATLTIRLDSDRRVVGVDRDRFSHSTSGEEDVPRQSAELRPPRRRSAD